MYGNESVTTNTNVTAYTLEANANAQKWVLRQDGTGADSALYTALSPTTYALNCVSASNDNANMYPAYINDNHNADKFLNIIDSNPAANQYRIKNASYGGYLTDTGVQSGVAGSYDVRWKAYSATNYAQIWIFEEVTPGSGGTTGYTGIMARNTQVAPASTNGTVFINKIPDYQFGTGIESNVPFHPNSGFTNGTDFSTSTDAQKVKEVLQKFVNKVYGKAIDVAYTTYYLFGERRDTSAGEYHPGVDIKGTEGDEIHALYGGTVVYSGGNYGTLGISVPGLGIVTNYIHMKDLRFNLNQTVNAGDVIGLQSNKSTESIGSHLHFEVRPAGSVGPAGLVYSTSSALISILPYGYMDGNV